MPSSLINLISPDGEIFHGPEEWANWALGNGYRELTPEEHTEQVEKFAWNQALKETGESTAGKVVAGLNAAGDAVTFGGVSALEKNLVPGGYEAVKAAQAANPEITAAGAVLGLAGTVATGKPVFDAISGAGKVVGEGVKRAVAPAVGETVAKGAGAVARYTTEGAITALPTAAGELFQGDPEEAMEVLLSGGVIGGALGTTISGASTLTGKFLDGANYAANVAKAKTREVANAAQSKVDAARMRIAQRLSGGTQQVNTAGQTFGDAVSSLGQSAGDLAESAVPAARNTLSEIEANQWEKALGINTKSIRSKLTFSDPERPKYLVGVAQKDGLLPTNLTDDLAIDPKAALDKIYGMKELDGKELAFIYKTIDKSGKFFVDSGKLADSLERLQSDVSKYDLLGHDDRIMAKLLERTLPTLRKADGTPKKVKLGQIWEMAQEVERFIYRNKRNPAVNTEAAQDARAAIRGTLSEALEAGADKQFQTLKGTPISGRVKELNTHYRDLSDLELGFDHLIDQMGNNQLTGMTSNFLTLIGAGIGGLPGAAMGMGAGYFRQKYGAQAAALLAKGANDALANRDRLIGDAVEKFFKEAGEGIKLAASAVRPKTTIQSLASKVLPAQAAPAAAKLQRSQAARSVADQMAILASDASSLTDRLHGVTGEISRLDPILGNAANGQLMRTLDYLRNEAPRAPSLLSPFEPPQNMVSDRDVDRFERQLQAALDPYSILDDLQTGFLDPDAVNTVKVLYPKFYEKLSSTLIERAGGQKKGFPYKVRAQLAVILGPAVDSAFAPSMVNMFQANHAAPDANVSPEKVADMQLSGTERTQVERSAAR